MTDPIKQAMDALEKIAGEQKVYLGHGDFDILPAYSAEEAQDIARAALSALRQSAPAVPEGDLISRTEVLRVCRELGEQSADLALYGASENARNREAMEAAATRIGCAIVLMAAAAPPPPGLMEDEWRPIETAPANTLVLVYWPAVELDEDGAPTEVRKGAGFVGVAERVGDHWSEPDALNAVGASFDDDWTYAPEPTHWMPLPPPPSDHPAYAEHTAGNGSGSPTLQRALGAVREFGEQYQDAQRRVATQEPELMASSKAIELDARGLTIWGGPDENYPIIGQVASGVPNGEDMAKL